MEPNSQFDIDLALNHWRGRIREHLALSNEDVEELESHLHDIIHSLESTPLSAAEKFLVASYRLGSPNQLGEQFERAKPIQAWRHRGLWMIMGIIALWTTTCLANLGSLATFIMGSHWTQNAATLGLGGLGVQALGLMLVPVLFWSWVRAGGADAAIRPPNWKRLVLGLFGVLIVLRALEWILFSWLVRTTGPSQLGGYYMTVVRLSSPMVILFVAAITVWLVRPFRLRPIRNCLMLVGVIGTLGCSPVDAATQSGTGAAANEKSVTAFEKIIAEAKEKPSDALKAFRQIDLSKSSLFSKGSPLSYSEAEFIKLPTAVNEKLAQQAQSDIRAIKEFASSMKKERDHARSRGDKTLANQLNSQLDALGKRLQGPQNLALSQIAGKAIARIAAE